MHTGRETFCAIAPPDPHHHFFNILSLLSACNSLHTVSPLSLRADVSHLLQFTSKRKRRPPAAQGAIPQRREMTGLTPTAAHRISTTLSLSSLSRVSSPLSSFLLTPSSVANYQSMRIWLIPGTSFRTATILGWTMEDFHQSFTISSLAPPPKPGTYLKHDGTLNPIPEEPGSRLSPR